MEYFHVRDMNDASRDPAEFIRWSEEQYAEKIERAAEQILDASRQGKPLVLLAGPSGSGKTTTAERMEQWLDSHGHPCLTISMDNYYYRREDGWLPTDEEGNVDYESPELLDMPLLREHLEKLAECKPIEMPVFDFAAQRRAEKTIPVQRRPGEIIVIEGIHALNPQVLLQQRELATGVYISVRTRVVEENGFVLHPSRIRLARRLLRDANTRGQRYEDTIVKLRSVTRGERLYIMPHKHTAEIQFNTFIPYELAAYRNQLSVGLNQMDRVFLEDEGVSELLPMLRQIDPVPRQQVPAQALIREFIGPMEKENETGKAE